jgi:hypothetical protein
VVDRSALRSLGSLQRRPPYTSTGARPYSTRLQPFLARSSTAALATVERARGKWRKIDA